MIVSEKQTFKQILIKNCQENKGITNCRFCPTVEKCEEHNVPDLIVEATEKWLSIPRVHNFPYQEYYYQVIEELKDELK